MQPVGYATIPHMAKWTRSSKAAPSRREWMDEIRARGTRQRCDICKRSVTLRDESWQGMINGHAFLFCGERMCWDSYHTLRQESAIDIAARQA